MLSLVPFFKIYWETLEFFHDLKSLVLRTRDFNSREKTLVFPNKLSQKMVSWKFPIISRALGLLHMRIGPFFGQGLSRQLVQKYCIFVSEWNSPFLITSFPSCLRGSGRTFTGVDNGYARMKSRNEDSPTKVKYGLLLWRGSFFIVNFAIV